MHGDDEETQYVSEYGVIGDVGGYGGYWVVVAVVVVVKMRKLHNVSVWMEQWAGGDGGGSSRRMAL